MAHATPVTSAPGRPARLPDVFDARTHRIAHVALPLVLGLIYGYWAAAMNRAGGPITGWNVLFGFVAAFAFMGLFLAVSTVAPRLRREPRAVLWGAFTGIAFGFLYSQNGRSVLHCSLMALGVGAAVTVAGFYRYYVHEDAGGRPTN